MYGVVTKVASRSASSCNMISRAANTEQCRQAMLLEIKDKLYHALNATLQSNNKMTN